MNKLQDLRIARIDDIVSPEELSLAFPMSDELRTKVSHYRETVNNIILGKDNRKLAIVGPCSIHDPEAALDYAERLKKLTPEIGDVFFPVMRTYFEKGRTSIGWKGLVFDPDLNGSNDIGKGLAIARSLLIRLTELGVPVGCEVLDPIIPQYIDELMCWASIGARTTEGQVHRNIASGLSIAVGFKNSTSGDLNAAINGMKSAASPAAFLGVSKDGKTMVFRTRGNDTCHLILRGGDSSPNYYDEDIENAESLLEKEGLNKAIIVDCSHGNSRKDFRRQIRVLRSVVDQIAWGTESIKGFMIESNINEGRQEILSDKALMKYGMSITDACLGWNETEESLKRAAEIIREGHVAISL